MKTYTVTFAQDVPYYGSVEIEAENDAEALARAEAYWQDVTRDEKPWPLDQPEYQSAILSRIVHISDDADREVACDVRLDNYVLEFAPNELDAKIFDNAKLIFAALELIAAHDIDQFDTSDANHQALYDAVVRARTIVATVHSHDPA